MSIANELTAVKAKLTARFASSREAVSIKFYDGTFSPDDLGKESFKPPAVFISCASATPLPKSLGVAELSHALGDHEPPSVVVYQMQCNFVAGVLYGKAGARAPQLSAWEIADQIPPILNADGGTDIELINAYDGKLFAKGMFLVVVKWRKLLEITEGAQSALTSDPIAKICIETK